MNHIFDQDIDPASEDGARIFADEAKQCAADLFQRHGEIKMPIVFLLARRDPKTRLSFKRPRIATCVFTPDFVENCESKDGLVEMIRCASARAEALGIAFVYEGWFLRQNFKTEEEGERLRRAYVSGMVENNPEKQEALMVVVEHKAFEGSFAHMAEILRDHVGRPTLAGFAEPQRQYEQARFSGLLPNL
jgi:hypothetical protein